MIYSNLKNKTKAILEHDDIDTPINRKIDALSKRIERNEKEQDRYVAKYGEQNDALYDQHEKLCDQMEELCNRRRNGFEESAGVSSEDLGHNTEDLKPNETGLEGITPEQLYGSPDSLGLARSEELTKSDYSDFFRDPKIMEKFTEHFDMSDRPTRQAILMMNEADQTSVLTALTSKLYDNIVEKVDDIDYGDIPGTKGDVTKLPNYQKLYDCIELLHKILGEFKQDTAPVDVLSEALSNVQTHKDLFERAFRFNCELPIIMYNTTVLSIINGVSYMIATTIEFMKTPNQDSFSITLDRVAYAKTKNHMIYNNLKKLNKSFKSGEFDKAMEHIIQNRIKGLSEAAAITAGTIGGIIAGGIGIGLTVALILNIIPILREMVFLLYYARMRVSDFFDVQADLLQMNAYNLQVNNPGDEKAERTVSKQLKIVEFFRKIANKISFSTKKAEVDSNKEIANSSRKMKLGELGSDVPESVSALF